MNSKTSNKIDFQDIQIEKTEIIIKTKIVDISLKINSLVNEEREYKVLLPENIIINKNQLISNNLL